MTWLKKWSYLLAMVVSGFLFFHYVDEWKVYTEAIPPMVEWYEEQSDRYEILAEVNEWGRDVFERCKAYVLSLVQPGDVSDETGVADEMTGNEFPRNEMSGNEEGNPGSEESQPGSEESQPEGGENQPESEEEQAESDVNRPESETNQPDDKEDLSGNESSQSGSHIVIGGPEEGLEVGFGEQGGAVVKEPLWHNVKDLYFEDAVFIGDSRTVGMYEYGGLENITTFYAYEGLSVYSVFDKKFVEVPGQKQKITVEEALQQNSFSKIYLMLGLNEMGTGTTETFLAKYGEVLNRLQELQPDAIIYVQAIMKLTTKRSGKGDQFHNPGIEERNEGLSHFADNEKIFYLDVNPYICDETGGMVPEYTYDGIHLKAKYVLIWKDFLKAHAIIP